MSEENKHYQRLEFNRIREKLSQYAYSDAAKETLRSLEPSVSIFEINRMQQETEEALRYLHVKQRPSFRGLTDIRELVKRSSLGGALTMGDFLVVADYLGTISRLKDYGQRENGPLGEFPHLDPRFDALQPIRPLEREIRRCILAEDEMADDASEKLLHIRREISKSEARIQSELSSMVHSETYRSSLQDPIVTVRDGRYCLPVKTEFKGNVRGMVHDQSSSGSTVFIEPMAVVELNNAIAQLRIDEQQEIARILRGLGKQLNDHQVSVLANFEILTQLDVIFAKASLAKEEDAVMPEMNEEAYIHLEKARHPLLDPEKVVPIDIWLGKEFTTLVITGPNTGGKTVTLKTLGLLQLMAQSGLHIPASGTPMMPVVDKVYADIGDEQSIEQSLSTFSSHMVNIVEILQQAGPKSLVLFDELGAGTDPVEGAALAQSILESLREKRILTAATTHYSELKVYALSTEGVENASCEFDVETLMPTYKLLIGVPGKSNAFAISRRLGLPDAIIHHASDLLLENDVKFEEMVSDLQMKQAQADKDRQEIERLKAETTRLRNEAASEKKTLEEQKERILNKAKQQAKDYLTSAKADADASIARINKIVQSGTGLDMRALEEERRHLREKAEAIKEQNRKSREEGLLPVKEEALIPGTRVKLKGLDQIYSVLESPDSRGRLRVQAGIMKMQTKVSDIAGIVPEEKYTMPRKEKGHGQSAIMRGKGEDDSRTHVSGSLTAHYEVDLRGMLTDEGIQVLDQFLDEAYLSGMNEVRVIHGKGTGAMRNAVHQYLKHAPHVSSYRLGVYGEGDTGVTIVELKKK